MALPTGVSKDSTRAIYETLILGRGVIDSAGTVAYPDNYEQVLKYNEDGTLNTIAFTDGTNTWTQTMTYTTGNLTGISKWVKS